MTWAMRRRFIVLFILGAVAVAFIAILGIATTYQAPSCIDGVQNQNETGIDCGGPCPYLCSADELPPTVLFTKAVSNGAGRVDVIASIENKNTSAAAKNVPYRVQLFGANQTVLREVSGTLDLPPGTTVPVYLPGLASERESVATAFFEIDPAAPKWFAATRDPRLLPTVSNSSLGGTPSAPRVQATLDNASSITYTNIQTVVLVRNAAGNVIGISSTVIPSILPQGQATATFTWNGPFSDTPTAIEVVPVIPLP